MRQKSHFSAFTLIEIMIVVVIIGILAAIAIPAFQEARAQSQRNSITENLRVIASAGQQYLISNGAETDVLSDDLVPTWLPKLPDPVAGEVYTGLEITSTVTGTGSTATPNSLSVTATINGVSEPIEYQY